VRHFPRVRAHKSFTAQAKSSWRNQPNRSWRIYQAKHKWASHRHSPRGHESSKSSHRGRSCDSTWIKTARNTFIAAVIINRPSEVLSLKSRPQPNTKSASMTLPAWQLPEDPPRQWIEKAFWRTLLPKRDSDLVPALRFLAGPYREAPIRTPQGAIELWANGKETSPVTRWGEELATRALRAKILISMRVTSEREISHQRYTAVRRTRTSQI